MGQVLEYEPHPPAIQGPVEDLPVPEMTLELEPHAASFDDRIEDEMNQEARLTGRASPVRRIAHWEQVSDVRNAENESIDRRSRFTDLEQNMDDYFREW